MTQEQKELLLKDLCARLPYGVKGQYLNSDDPLLRAVTISYGSIDKLDGMVMDGSLVPWLFPLSSMTDKQIMESPTSIHVCDLENLRYDDTWTELNSRFPDLIDLIDWLNKNHFDYRGLISMGLANDATGKNIYKYE